MPDLLLYINSRLWRFVHFSYCVYKPRTIGARRRQTARRTRRSPASAGKDATMELVRRFPYVAAAGQSGGMMTETLVQKVRLGGRTDGFADLLRHIGAWRHASHLWLQRLGRARGGDGQRNSRRADQLHRHGAHLRRRAQRGAPRRGASRTRRPARRLRASTKVDRDPDTGVFDAAQARRSLETSLGVLGRESFDLLYLHDFEYARSPAEATSRDGALGELFRIKAEGLAKAVGLAAGKVKMMIPLLQDWDFDAVMTQIASRWSTATPSRCSPSRRRRGRGDNAAPYASGVLAKGSVAYPHYAYQQADDAALAPIRRIEAISARYDVPLGAAALQFSLRDKRVTSTVCGVTKPERVKETLDWARFPILRHSGRRSRACRSPPTTQRRRAFPRTRRADNGALRDARAQ